MNRLATLRPADQLLLASWFRLSPIAEKIRPLSVSAVRVSNKNDEIARFPVQPLNKTLEKYLKTIKPLVDQKEYNNAVNLCNNFNGQVGIGPKLQKLLEDRALVKENWFEDYWINTAYLEYRDPVVIFSSPGLVWPQTSFKSVEDQIKYATTVINAALNFNDVLQKKQIPQEKMGSAPLDMQQYYKILGTTRVPRPGRDEMKYQDPANPSSNIIVMHQNHLFNMIVYEGEERKRLNDTQIYAQLRDIVKSSVEPGAPIGALTSNNRDEWAAAYDYLTKVDRNNIKILNKIQTALFVVCIDQPLPSMTHPNDRTRTSTLVLHGNGVRNGNGGNRWYDKTLQFVIGAGADGVGINYEHSPAEGGPIGVLTDNIINKVTNEEAILKPPVTYPKPEKLELKLDNKLEDDIKRAGENIDSLINNLELWGFTFDKFGKNQLKKLKVSPDSFVQVAIQLAFYKVHGKPTAQYESGSLRKFLHGRTDIIRTCSSELLEFCQATSDTSMTTVQLSKLLRTALNAHKNYVSMVVNGEGIDRHLLGLKLIAAENNIETPKLYTDSAYKKTTYFKLSTSNVPSNCDGFMIYGPLVKDGYACCYNPRSNSINFGTSAWKDCDVTNLSRFKAALEESLLLMQDVLSTELQLQSKL